MPTKRMLNWAAAAIGSGARVIDARPLHGEEAPWLLSIEHAGNTTTGVLKGGPPSPRVGPFMVAVGGAALEAAERYGLSAPRLIGADLDGVQTGGVTTLETVVSGSTRWPAPPAPERLRAAGAAPAQVHAIAMTPTEHLPFRPRPIAVDDFAADRRNGRMPTTRLLEEADELITAHGLPRGATVFVHGDVWPGNIIWTADEVPVLIDWKTAGVGAPGVDLGELRKQVAIIFDPEAPELVIDGWERAMGRRPEDVAYWDAVAALNTRTELDDGYRSGGWAPLVDGAEATDRRDAFLRAALTYLGR
jgi:aminoglycoside phosphotransferase (APT) family kinase protein